MCYYIIKKVSFVIIAGICFALDTYKKNRYYDKLFNNKCGWHNGCQHPS